MYFWCWLRTPDWKQDDRLSITHRTRLAIYARVSANDGRQTVDNQLTNLRTFASSSDWQIVAEYIDHDSGGKPNRKQLTELLTHITAAI